MNDRHTIPDVGLRGSASSPGTTRTTNLDQIDSMKG